MHAVSSKTLSSVWRSASPNGIDAMRIDTESDEGAWAEHQRLMELFNKLRAKTNAENDEAEEGS